MHHRRPRHAFQRAVQRLHAELHRLFRPGLQPGFVELNDISAGGLEVPRLLCHGGGIGHGDGFRVAIILVMRLHGEGEGARQGDLDLPVGIGAQKFHVAHLDRVAAADRADNARHWCGFSGPAHDDGGVVHIDAIQGQGEAVGIALSPHFAIGDDVDAGPLHVADRDQGGVILRLFQRIFGHPPNGLQPHPGHHIIAHQNGAVDQPIWLRIASHDGGGQKRVGHGVVLSGDVVGRWLRRICAASRAIADSGRPCEIEGDAACRLL